MVGVVMHRSIPHRPVKHNTTKSSIISCVSSSGLGPGHQGHHGVEVGRNKFFPEQFGTGRLIGPRNGTTSEQACKRSYRLTHRCEYLHIHCLMR